MATKKEVVEEKEVVDSTGTLKEEVSEVVEAPKIVEGSPEWYEEEIEIRLFKDNGKYKEPLFVALNGQSLLIERGKRVKVKRKFAEIIEQSLDQDEYANSIIEKNVREYEKNQAQLS